MSAGRVTDGRERLRDLLDRTRNADGGWPYYAGRRSRLEPTAWGLLALGDGAAAGLLASWRSADDLLVEPAVNAVNFGFNAIAALALASHARRTGGQPADASALVRGLIAHKGVTVPQHAAIRQDGSLQGWSWTDGTFSWIEPTAWCLLAIKKLAPFSADAGPRIAEAERLLRDRVCGGGGWNFGNAEVFGQQLPAHVPPSAVGVLAMQDRRDDPMVRDAVAFLRRAAPLEGSTTALALTYLALQAVDAADESLAVALDERVSMAREFGNVSAAALLLYALDLEAAGLRPQAFLL